MANSNTANSSVTPSRLLTETTGLRERLISRNLYNPDRIYPITEKDTTQNIINAVDSIIDFVAPFKSYDLKNTVYGRLITQRSPLTDIGLAMLGNQFMLNASSHIAQQTFPKIKVANLFDGSKDTRLFTNNVNFKITKNTAITNFQQFLDSVTFFNPESRNPFNSPGGTTVNTMPLSSNPKIQNDYYIKQTGTGQISFLFNAFNQNIYKEGWGKEGSSPTDDALQVTASDAQVKFYKRDSLIGNAAFPNNKYKNYYNFLVSNPYTTLKLFPELLGSVNSSITLANSQAVISMNNTNPQTSSTQEYAPNINFVKENFGVGRKFTDYEISKEANDWVNTADEFSDVSKDKIVWGRDGINVNTNQKLQGSTDTVTANRRKSTSSLKDFQVYSGVLEYTRNLLNASEGSLVDITRKAFLNGKNVEGFNGSSLWVANSSTYAIKNQIAGETGVRQHSALDPYDKFAKAIRFNGSSVYEGNPNSVTYKSVMPRIHPTIDKDKSGKDFLNNKNLMFSLENLAVRVISNQDGFGIIDDEYGSVVPACEVGQFNGRMMWFPPYDISIQESTAAKYESTVMVGRSEPIYSYQNSERSATLAFTLLVDYPMQLKDIKYQGPDKHRIISEFFAFGGDPYGPLTPVKDPDIPIPDEPITGPLPTAPPEEKEPAEIKMVFPNDYPKSAEISNAADNLYSDWQYEIKKGSVNAAGRIVEGWNKDIFVKTGMSGDTISPSTDPNHLRLHLPLPGDFSQYTATGTTDCPLNYNLKDIYSNPINRNYYDITVRGGASKLYIEDPNAKKKKESKYNTALGKRRAEAAIKLVRERIKALFGDYPENLTPAIKVVLDESTRELTDTAGSTGSVLAPPSSADVANIEKDDTIQSRYALIVIKRNTTNPEDIKPLLSEEDKENLAKITADNQAKDSAAKKQKSKAGIDCVYNERGIDNDAILNGFKAISGNYYYPAFHSQTPEDFHRRLTFLQQCMRQGAAIRYDMVDEKNTLRAKNSVFRRQPICIMRIGDFLFTKVVIENLTIDYADVPWDMNPEGFGMQPMMAKITLQMKIIGGQSLKGPIDALQNAVTFNHYANSNYTNAGMYFRPSAEADKQESYINGILTKEKNTLQEKYKDKSNPTSKK